MNLEKQPRKASDITKPTNGGEKGDILRAASENKEA
jgi:hypothetical protein